jgi:vacuolar-type H+-ATPase subunit H
MKNIKKTEKELEAIKKELLVEINEIGSTKAAEITGKTKQYFTDLLHNRKTITYNQILELAKKLL